MPIAKDVYGTVFENGSVVLLARVVSDDGETVTRSGFATASYSIKQVAACNGGEAIGVEGHQSVNLPIASVLFDTLQTGGSWSLDDEGYNFRHEVDVRSDAAFPSPGKDYQVRYELLPHSGQPVILRFILRAI